MQMEQYQGLLIDDSLSVHGSPLGFPIPPSTHLLSMNLSHTL